MAKKNANNIEGQKLATLGAEIMGIAGFADVIVYTRKLLKQLK